MEQVWGETHRQIWITNVGILRHETCMVLTLGISVLTNDNVSLDAAVTAVLAAVVVVVLAAL